MRPSALAARRHPTGPDVFPGKNRGVATVRIHVPRLHDGQVEQIQSQKGTLMNVVIEKPTRVLAERRTGSVEILLLWHPMSNEVELRIHDTSKEAELGFRVPPGEAMEAFRHPYAYAARQGYSALPSRTASIALEPLVCSNYWERTDDE